MNYDLFEIVLFLDHAVSLLNLIAVGGLPHVVVGHYALYRFPRKLCMCIRMCVRTRDKRYEKGVVTRDYTTPSIAAPFVLSYKVKFQTVWYIHGTI